MGRADRRAAEARAGCNGDGVYDVTVVANGDENYEVGYCGFGVEPFLRRRNETVG